MADDSGDPSAHELEQFLDQDQAELAAEYERIFARSTQDPGTAGDEGEENWAYLLSKWLPADYRVVTKGRILFADKSASPQIDVLVLRRGYPERLLQKKTKLYLSSGVVAAFECKNTLKAEHIGRAAEAAALVKAKANRRIGTPRDELKSPPYFGILAHSHSWKAPKSTPRDNIDTAIWAILNCTPPPDPPQLIDAVCVADLGTWTVGYFIECPKFWDEQTRGLRLGRGVRPEGQVVVGYWRYRAEMFEEGSNIANPNPIAVFIDSLLGQLAWSDPDLRPMSDYFRMAGLGGSAGSLSRAYGLDEVFTLSVQRHFDFEPPTMGPESFWDPWSFHD